MSKSSRARYFATRKQHGEVVGGRFIIGRRGASTNRIRLIGKHNFAFEYGSIEDAWDELLALRLDDPVGKYVVLKQVAGWHPGKMNIENEEE